MSELIRKFLLQNPTVWRLTSFFGDIWNLWVFHRRSDIIATPRYLVESTDSRIAPCNKVRYNFELLRLFCRPHAEYGTYLYLRSFKYLNIFKITVLLTAKFQRNWPQWSAPTESIILYGFRSTIPFGILLIDRFQRAIYRQYTLECNLHNPKRMYFRGGNKKTSRKEKLNEAAWRFLWSEKPFLSLDLYASVARAGASKCIWNSRLLRLFNNTMYLENKYMN